MKEIEVVSELTNFDNFFDAALALSYSPSVISKYVSKIEEELGFKIFSRSNKTNELSLTPEGRILIQDIHKIHNTYRHMMEMSSQLQRPVDNILRIGSVFRLGNMVEREVLALYMQHHEKINIEQVKMGTLDLMRLLRRSKLDALFITMHQDSDITAFLSNDEEINDLEISLLAVEKSLYLAVSDELLPDVKDEAEFEVFRDFAFAFAFPRPINEGEEKILLPFQRLAAKSGFDIQAAHFGANDPAIMKLATKMQIAVVMTSIPAYYEHIKFIKIKDWNAEVKLYFVRLKNNNKKTIRDLQKSVDEYIRQNKPII